MIDLTGQHIFIAGGSRGIGAAAARMAAKAGARVSFTYRQDESAAKRLVEEIGALYNEDGGGSSLETRNPRASLETRAPSERCLAFKAEISEETQIDQAMDQAVQKLGPLTGLVVSASVFEGCYLEEMTPEFWDRTMAINVRGSFLCVRAAARHMRQAGKGGSIVIYTSTAGQRGSAEYSAYATSKGAQILFMRSMAKELAHDKIRVNCIAPAWTDTDMAAPSFEAIGRDKIIEGFPLGRIGTPEDVAGATVFLLSELASFITGSTITVDGGMDMRG